MNKTIFFAVLCLILANPSFAQKPTQPSKEQEKPVKAQKAHKKLEAKHSRPLGLVKKSVQKEFSSDQMQFEKAVLGYIKSHTSEEDGLFHFLDEELENEWALTLKKIHLERIIHLGEGRYYACVDFVEKGNEQEEMPDIALDMDFYVNKESNWDVEEVLIHSVDGELRYTYDQDNKRVLVKQGEVSRP
ncbi:MAG: hypothetical protein HY400_07505 [Elusimicrobia bacterium]|nr:hypothetical protein [Elusimicrobiota bacterium]